MAKTLTSADSVFFLTITDLFPVPFVVERYSINNPFSNSKVTLSETRRTLDNKLERGYIPGTVITSVTLEPTSNTRPIIIQWASASITTQSAYSCNGSLTIPGLGEEYILTNGALLDVDLLVSSAKTLNPISFSIEWEGFNVGVLPG